MTAKYPKIDTRSTEQLLEEIKTLIPIYTPEWVPERNDVGLALLQIFNRMFSSNIQRLNKIPEKHFMAFLDMIGIKLLPAQSAKVPLTFLLAEGTNEPVLIPERTQVGAGDVDFETEENILAVDSKIIKAYSIDISRDCIYESPENVLTGKLLVSFTTNLLYIPSNDSNIIFVENFEGLNPGDHVQIADSSTIVYAIISEISENMITLTEKLNGSFSKKPALTRVSYYTLFIEKNLQEHTLYLGHKDLINVEGNSLINITFSNSNIAPDITRFDLYQWEFRAENQWFPLSIESFNNSTKTLTLKKEREDKIAEYEINSIKNHWIRCKIKDIFKINIITLSSIKYSVGKIFNTDVIPHATYSHTLMPNSLHKDRIIDGRKIHFIYDFTVENDQFKYPIYPFENYTQNLTVDEKSFYIVSNEVFLKRGSTITLSVTFSNEFVSIIGAIEDPSLDPVYPKIEWEYWGKVGENEYDWKSLRIISDNTHNMYYKPVNNEKYNGLVTFICPSDINSTRIRIRLESGNYGKIVDRDSIKYSNNRPPRIFMLSLYYCNLSPYIPNNNYGKCNLKIVNGLFGNPIYPFGNITAFSNQDSNRIFYIANNLLSRKGYIIAMRVKFHNTFVKINNAQYDSTIGEINPRLAWEYWNGITWTNLNVIDSTNNLCNPGSNIIFFQCPMDIKTKEENGYEDYWIRIRIVSGNYGWIEKKDEWTRLSNNTPPKISLLSFSEYDSIQPDFAFNNAGQCDLTLVNGQFEKSIYPFEDFTTNDKTFYIASNNVFSKKGSTISLFIAFSNRFVSINGATYNSTIGEINPLLVWEYWNGNTWAVLDIISDNTKNLYYVPEENEKLNGLITFICPMDINKVLMNGYETYWIRVRIVSGNYGWIGYIKDGDNFKAISNNRPPEIFFINLSYSTTATQTFENCLAYNNLNMRDYSIENLNSDKLFQPFYRFDNEYNSLYLGFNNKIEKGPISLFCWIEEMATTLRPKVRWQYYTENKEWVKLETIDETDGFLKSGMIKFVFPKDFMQSREFGLYIYWIRAIIDIKTFNPTIKGLYLNTAWAVQEKSIKNEMLGSSDGVESQTYTLKNVPVIDEEIWINEIKTIPDEDRNAILEKGEYTVNQIIDDQENIIEFWVKWKPIEMLLESDQNGRHYTLDRVTGVITFGDGIYGKIPPIGEDNIKAHYKTGGGVKGNVDAYEIKDIKSSIPYLDKAFNPIPSSNGVEFELIEDTVERGPKVLKNRNRAVAVEDFEYIVVQASRSVARVKCIPNYNGIERKCAAGWVTIIVIPLSNEKKPRLSLLLKKEIEVYLKEHTITNLVDKDQIYITEPDYIEVSVKADLIAESIDLVSIVENSAISLLEKYLHPLTGGSYEKGWEFGRIPYYSDIYGLLEDVKGVDYVKDVTLYFKRYSGNKAVSDIHVTRDTFLEEGIFEYAVVCSGIHTINVNIMTK